MKATKTGPDPWVGRIEGSAPWESRHYCEATRSATSFRRYG